MAEEDRKMKIKDISDLEVSEVVSEVVDEVGKSAARMVVRGFLVMLLIAVSLTCLILAFNAVLAKLGYGM